MNGNRIDLLPPVFGARARLRMLHKRLGIAFGVTVILLLGLSFHARITRAHSERSLMQAREHAEQVLHAERREKSLRENLRESRERVEAWRRVALPLPIGSTLVTMVNMLADNIVLEKLDIDVLNALGSSAHNANPSTERRRVIGRIVGFAPDDAVVREFVFRLRGREPFEEVRRGFTAREEQGDVVRTRFSVEFEVDLDVAWAPVVEWNADLQAAAADGGQTR